MDLSNLMSRSSLVVCAGVALIGGVLPSVGAAAVVVTPSFSNASWFAFPASGTSLIEAGSSTFESVSPTDAPAGGIGVLNDGAVGDNETGFFYQSIPEYSVTYVLDTTVNTAGYDITSIASITGWSASRIGQYFNIQYTNVNDEAFTLASGVFSDPGEAGSLKVALTDTTGVLATGVKSVTFAFPVYNGAVYRELEVEGSATAVPEPASFGLLGLGAAMALRRRR